VIVSCTLTRNSTWTPPNQVTYLKGSSMDSFTLGLLPKIDFNMSTATAQRQWLENKLISTITPKLYSLSSKEFNTEFLQITYLEASIYRLQKTQSESGTVFSRRRSDGSWERPRRTIVQPAFQKRWYSFLDRAASERCYPSVRTVALQLQAISIIRIGVRRCCPDVRKVAILFHVLPYQG
jgi:hypothetical protein